MFATPFASAFSRARSIASCDDLDADHAPRGARQREPDRAGAAVQIPDDLAAGEAGLLDRVAVEHVGHLGVRLQERAGGDAQAQAADLLLEPGPPEERPRRDAAGDLGDAVVDRVQHADDSGRALGEQRLSSSTPGTSPGRSRGCTAARPCARPRARRDGAGSRCSRAGRRPRAPGRAPTSTKASRTALPRSPVSRQTSSGTISSQRPARWKPSATPSGVARPGVLELVAVGVLAHGRHDRLDRRVRQRRDALERVQHLLLLVLELPLVAQVLPAAAAADAEVRARRLDAIGPARERARTRPPRRGGA